MSSDLGANDNLSSPDKWKSWSLPLEMRRFPLKEKLSRKASINRSSIKALQLLLAANAASNSLRVAEEKKDKNCFIQKLSTEFFDKVFAFNLYSAQDEWNLSSKTIFAQQKAKSSNRFFGRSTSIINLISDGGGS